MMMQHQVNQKRKLLSTQNRHSKEDNKSSSISLNKNATETCCTDHCNVIDSCRSKREIETGGLRKRIKLDDEINQMLLQPFNGFEFFEKELSSDFKDKFAQINFGLKLKIEKLETSIKFFYDIDDLKDNNLRILSSNSPHLTIASISKFLRMKPYVDMRFQHIFISITDLKLSPVARFVIECYSFPLNPFLIIDCSNDVEKHSLESLFDTVSKIAPKKRVILVASAKEALTLASLFREESIVMEIKHHWNQIDDEYKRKILDLEIFFQGKYIKLETLLPKSSPIVNFLPINDVILNNEIKVGEELVQPLDNFVDRKFIKLSCKSTQDLENGVSEREKFSAKVITAEQLLKFSETENVILISAVAGMGKSECFKQFAFAMKESFPTCWVSLIELKCHINYFKLSSIAMITFEDFISEMVLNKENPFEEELFKHLYREGKVRILLDGFDEISPVWKEQVLKLIQLFRSHSGNQLWVSTRPNYQNELESNMRRLSYSIIPFSYKEQVDYLTSFWKSNDTAVKFVDQISELSNRNGNFLSSPLLISIVGDTKDRDLIVDGKFNSFSMYEALVKRLLKIWRYNKGELSIKDQEDLEYSSTSVIGVHQKLASTLTFGESNNEVDRNDWSKERLTRVGIVHFCPGSKSLQFIHRTFTEFFCASFVISKLEKHGVVSNETLQLLFKITNETKFVNVRSFLENALQTLGKNINSCYQDTVMVIIKNYPFCLLNIVKERRLKLLELMLKLPILREVAMNLLQKSTGNGTNCLHFAVLRGSNDFIDKFLEFMNIFLRGDDIRILLQTSNKESQNVFHFGAENIHNEGIFGTLLKYSKEFLSCNQLIKLVIQKDEFGKNFIHYCVEIQNFDLFKRVMLDFEALLGPKHLKELLLATSTDGENILHLAIKFASEEGFENFISCVEDLFELEEQKALILGIDSYDQSIFHYACKNVSFEGIFEPLAKYVWYILTKDETSHLLRQKDAFGRNVLNIVCEIGNEKALKTLLSIPRSYLPPDLSSWLQEKEHHNRSFLFRMCQVIKEKELKMKNSEILSDDEDLLSVIKNFLNIQVDEINFKESSNKVSFIKDQRSMNFNREIKKIILEENQKANRDYILKLMSKSKLANCIVGLSDKYMSKLKEIFDSLSRIPEIDLMLKFVSRSDKLNIILDFTSTDVCKIDPSRPKSETGAFFMGEQKVLIAAKSDSDHNDILGTIAHELCHCAMKMIYDNSCRPYKLNDEKSKDRFEEIIKKTRNRNQDKLECYEQSIQRVFSNYEENMWPAELITSVPEMLVKYRNNRKARCFQDFNELFEYFNKKVLNNLETEELKFQKSTKTK